MRKQEILWEDTEWPFPAKALSLTAMSHIAPPTPQLLYPVGEAGDLPRTKRAWSTLPSVGPGHGGGGPFSGCLLPAQLSGCQSPADGPGTTAH